MSSWLAALGPCASPKSKSKERKNDNSLGKPLNLSSLKRRGSLTDIRNTRKVTGSRSFREKIHNTFDGSLRRAKKAGSLEAVGPDARSTTFGNPDTNMNVATSLSPKTQRGNNSDSAAFGNQDQAAVKDKFWTNFYNTLPRNRHKSDRPQDLSLQDLPVTERDSEVDIPNSSSKEVEMELKPAQSDGQWQVYATSPRTKRKNKTLERMNSAPSTRKSPMLKAYEIENRAGSEGTASPQIIDTPEGFEHMTSAGGFVIMPRSVSLQEEYWMPSTKGGSRVELRRVTPSPDRLMIRHSPVGNPMHIQGHVWVKSKDGSHMELHAIERHPREIPSPSDSQKTDLSSLSYSTAASSLSNFVSEDSLPQGYASSTTQTSDQLPYMSPEEYQANIFELIQSLNQSPPNPASPEIKRSKEVRQSRSPSDMKQMPAGNTDDSRTFHSEKFIVLGNTAEDQGSRSDDYVKREQPIFSVRAHVFQIDPETKKNWLPASKSAVAVSYYYDSARNTYRIISVEGSKAIINSTITPNMAFTKTSQKFGQWSDPRANTVYGLGFGTEADLAKFIEKFKDVKELTRQVNHSPQSPTTVNGTSDESHSSSNTPRETPPSRGFFHTRSSSLTSMREPTQPAEQKESVNLRERRNSFNTPGSNGTTANNSPENQLKYENDRLKLALAQSSANAKKWEIELQTLKNNNARLTAALQESTANVEEWKKQLAGYKDETSRMKKKIVELEKKQNNPDQVSALQTDVSQLNERVEGLQRDNQYKDDEVDRLQQRLAEMTTRETANGNLQNKFKAMEEENRGLQQQVRDLQQLVQDNQGSHESEKDELLQLQDHLGSKITELYEFHEQIIATIRKESTS